MFLTFGTRLGFMTFVLEPKSQALNPKPQTPIPYEPVNPNLKSLVILIVSLRGAFGRNPDRSP